MARALHSVGVVLVLLLVALVAVAAGAPGETVSIRDSLDVPDQTTEYHDRNFTIEAVKRADPGANITVDATVVDADPYRVHIRNGDDDLVASSPRQTENATVTFDLTNYTAGTYLVGVNQDGYYRAIEPLVVRGYAVSADVPSSARSNESLNATISVTKLRGPDLDRVQLVVGNDSHLLEANATREGLSYEVSMDISTLAPGEYAAYATVRGPDQAFGRQELLGASDRTTVTVDGGSSDGGDTDDGGSTGGGGGGGGAGGGGDSDGGGGSAGTDDPPRTAVRTATATTTATPAPTRTPTATATPTESVITPNPTTPVTPTTTTGQPGFEFVVGVLAIVASILAARRRAR